MVTCQFPIGEETSKKDQEGEEREGEGVSKKDICGRRRREEWKASAKSEAMLWYPSSSCATFHACSSILPTASTSKSTNDSSLQLKRKEGEKEEDRGKGEGEGKGMERYHFERQGIIVRHGGSKLL